MEHLDEVASQYDFVETEVIGQSWEGRDLKIVKICRGLRIDPIDFFRV